MAVRLWIDVEDLFDYLRSNYRRPSGIQRLTFEVCRELQARYGSSGQVGFVRHSWSGNDFQIVTWSQVAALFANLVTGEAPPPAPAVRGPVLADLPGRPLIRRLSYRLSPALRTSVAEALVTQAAALRAWGKVFRALARAIVKLPRRLTGSIADDISRAPSHDASPAPPPTARFTDLAAAGDILLMPGVALAHLDYAGLIERLCKARGLRFAVLLHDLIPVRRPEWCDRSAVAGFRRWIDGVLPLCDVVFAVSRATAADVEAYAREHAIRLPGPVLTLPLGNGLRHPVGTRTPRLPPPGSYALFVSTIDARKNHLLLFRVWRRMLEEQSPDRVPTLVFAGRIGWQVADLMQQIVNSDNLGGKLMILENPSDAELAALYDGCLFTLFPSFFEGWGLPVTESLGFGKPCLIANRTSLPEAGGDLVRGFDPDNLHDAYAVIRDAIEDRAGLARWEDRIRREFKPVPWSATVDALLAGLGDPLAVVGG